MAGRQHAAIVVEFRKGKVVALGLDASPFNREAIGIQTQIGQHPDIVAEAMIVIAGIERWLREKRGLDVLEHPQVAVDVITFYLMRGGSCAP